MNNGCKIKNKSLPTNSRTSKKILLKLTNKKKKNKNKVQHRTVSGNNNIKQAVTITGAGYVEKSSVVRRFADGVVRWRGGRQMCWVMFFHCKHNMGECRME